MRKILSILFFLPLFGKAQSLDYDTTFADGAGYNWKASVHLPADYYTSNKYYKLIMFIPGTGEIGGGYPALDTYGPLAYIDGGWNGGVTLGNGTHYPILIALEPWTDYATTGSRTATVVNAIVNRYRVQPGCVYATGLSAGGYAWKVMVTYDSPDTSPPYGPFSNADKIAALFDLQGVVPDINADWYNRVRNFANNQYAGQYFGIWDNLDAERGIARFKDSMNAAVPGSGRVIVTNNGHTATAWNAAYGSSAGAAPVNYTIDGISQTIYQWLLRQGDTTFMTSASPIIGDAGTDFAIIYDQGGAARSFTLTGSQVRATVPVYSWAALAGNPSAVSITSPSSASTTVTGANVPGYYGFELTVTENGNAEIQDKDTVYIQLRDLMQRGLRPCRVGQPQVFTIGDQLIPGRVTTTEIYMQYITRDNLLPDLMGGDILQVKANPNHANGWWNSIQMGDISGGPGCPIRIVPDSASGVTRVSAPAGGTRGWYFANADSNSMAYFILDGTYWHSRTGNWYGFQGDNSQYSYDSSDVITNSLNTGMAAQLIHHAEITGWYFNNVGHGFQFKKNSDSTKLFTIWNNFRQSNIHLHHNQVYKSNYEGVYGGHTDWDGSYQAGNDGRTIMLDSILVEKNIFFKTGLDGIQISNHGPGAIVRNNLVYQSGYRNGSSHRWSIFIGGNANGVMHGNTIINARGPAGALGYGTVRFYNNIIDSVNDGGNVESAMYINKSSWTGNTDSLKMFIEGNIISRVANTSNQSFVYVVNSAGLMGKGAIRNNTLVHPSKTTIGQMVTTNAGDTVTGNIILPAINLDTTALAQQDSYRVYKELLLTNAPGTKISFRDLPPLVQPQRGFRLKGKRFKFKINL